MMHIDPNDPEVIESLTFLLIPKEEKIQTQSRPFDPKKNVFVHDNKEGFIEGEIHPSCLACFERDAVCSSRHGRGGCVIHHEGHTA